MNDKVKIGKIIQKIETGLEGWTDEEVLTVFATFFDRVTISSQFLENEDGLYTHQIMTIQCGDKVIVSDPGELDWPLQMLPRPAALGEIN